MKPHRWVTSEPDIPFGLEVLYEDAGIIVVDKPHFLATTPRGMWYRQTALIRLREQYGEPEITPAHRLDRMTAGVLVFVRDPALRRAYQMLFQERRVRKIYECLAPCAPPARPRTGTVRRLEPPRPFPLERRSRIVKDRGRLQAYEVPGLPNARTVVERRGWSLHPAEASPDGRGPGQGPQVNAARVERRRRIGEPEPRLARYVLKPFTGKTHQLRVHMASLGLPIAGDDLYPRIVERSYDDFTEPLELVARELSFNDPVTGEPRRFVSHVRLGGG